MAGTIQTITEKEQFGNIFNQAFVSGDIFLKTQNGNLNVKFLGYGEGKVAFRVPYLKNIPATVLVITRHNFSTIYAALNFFKKEEEEVFVFEPSKIQIITAPRKEDRTAVYTPEEGSAVISITDVITDFIIEKSLALYPKKVENFRESILGAIRKLFKHVKVYFLNEGKSDTRMRYFYDSNRPYLICNFKEITADQDKNDYSYFIENIYAKDYYLINRKSFISEASVPLSYHGLIPYGYIQVNNENNLNLNSLEIVKRVAQRAESLIQQMDIFDLSKDKLLVSDLSQGGIGIVFKERRFLRYFNENSFVHFELLLPDNLKVTMLCIVRNITLMENKIIKVGCEIKTMDPHHKSFFNSFLEEYNK